MSAVAEIKSKIDMLSPEEFCELMAMLRPTEDDDWDRQMRADSAAGKFDKLIAEANEELATGRTIPLDNLIEDAS